VRNSSPVEWLCAEDDRGLSLLPKLRVAKDLFRGGGRGAFCKRWSSHVSEGGVYRREYPGMSSENSDEKSERRNPKVSPSMLIKRRLGGP